MKKLLCLALPVLAFAKPTQAPPPPAWDANLFRSDKQVVSGHLEFLYWKAQEGCLDYAVKMKSPAWTPTGALTGTLAVGDYKNGSFDFDPGLRVSLSYFRAPKEWEVWGSYTRLTARGHDSASKPDQTNLFLNPTWQVAVFLNTPLSGAKSSTHLNYNVADAMANRYFHPNAHLRLRLLGGITAAWMSQNWVIQYFTSNIAQQARVQNQWKFGGAGFRFGVMADWFWTSDIYLTARGTVGALMGFYKNQTKSTTTVAGNTSTDNPAIPFSNTTYRDGRATLTMQAMLGPSWQKSFDRTRVEVFAGYEINTWSNLQEVFRSGSSPSTLGPVQTFINSSLLSFQGLTTRLTMDF